MLSAKVGIFSLSYAVIPSFLVSVFFIDPYFILKFVNFLYANFFRETVLLGSVSLDHYHSPPCQKGCGRCFISSVKMRLKIEVKNDCYPLGCV